MKQSPNKHRTRWPVFVFVLIVVATTIYAFSPRPLPPFPPTVTKINKLLITGLTRQGERIIAVGELGQILWANSAAGPWHHAKVPNADGMTFTNVRFVAPHVAIAVGHGALIMRSADGGETWQRVSYQPKLGKSLMGITDPINGKLVAYGFFGLWETSSDGGKTWTTHKLAIKPLPAKKNTSASAIFSGGNPLANYVPQEDPSTRHFYGLTQLANGDLLLVGERGLIALSSDGGATFVQQRSDYPGSYFGVLKPTPGSVLIYGLQGRVYRSTDGGHSWTRIRLPQPLSVFGGTVLADGRVVLVGEQQSVWVSSDGGQHFRLASSADHGALDTVIGISRRQLMVGGIFGAHPESLTPPGTSGSTGARQ